MPNQRHRDDCWAVSKNIRHVSKLSRTQALAFMDSPEMYVLLVRSRGRRRRRRRRRRGRAIDSDIDLSFALADGKVRSVLFSYIGWSVDRTGPSPTSHTSETSECSSGRGASQRCSAPVRRLQWHSVSWRQNTQFSLSANLNSLSSITIRNRLRVHSSCAAVLRPRTVLGSVSRHQPSGSADNAPLR